MLFSLGLLFHALCDEPRDSLIKIETHRDVDPRDDEEVDFGRPNGWFLITDPDSFYVNIASGCDDIDDDDGRKCDWYHIAKPAGVIQLGEKRAVVQIVAKKRSSLTVISGYLNQDSGCSSIVANSSMNSGQNAQLSARQTVCYINTQLKNIQVSGQLNGGIEGRLFSADGTSQLLAESGVAMSLKNTQDTPVPIGITFSGGDDDSMNYGTVSKSVSKPTVTTSNGDEHTLSSGRCTSENDCDDDWDDDKLPPGAIAGIVVGVLVVVVIIIVIAVVASRKKCGRSETVHNDNETTPNSLQREATNPSLGVNHQQIIPPAPDNVFPEVTPYPHPEYPTVPQDSPYGAPPPPDQMNYDPPYMGPPPAYPGQVPQYPPAPGPAPGDDPYDPSNLRF